MLVAQRPGPENGSRAENKGAAVGAVERQVVRLRARGDRVALVDQDPRPGDGRFRQLDQPCRPVLVLRATCSTRNREFPPTDPARRRPQCWCRARRGAVRIPRARPARRRTRRFRPARKLAGERVLAQLHRCGCPRQGGRRVAEGIADEAVVTPGASPDIRPDRGCSSRPDRRSDRRWPRFPCSRRACGIRRRRRCSSPSASSSRSRCRSRRAG